MSQEEFSDRTRTARTDGAERQRRHSAPASDDLREAIWAVPTSPLIDPALRELGARKSPSSHEFAGSIPLPTVAAEMRSGAPTNTADLCIYFEFHLSFAPPFRSGLLSLWITGDAQNLTGQRRLRSRAVHGVGESDAERVRFTTGWSARKKTVARPSPLGASPRTAQAAEPSIFLSVASPDHRATPRAAPRSAK
jgi:hypothetical protein